MAISKRRPPSPIRAGFLHGFLSLAVFGGVFGLVGAGIHLTGDPAEAGPIQIVALFERNPQAARSVRTGLVDGPQTLQEIELAEAATGDDVIERVRSRQTAVDPNLGVADPGQTENQQPVQAAAATQARGQGMTINGVFVPVGRSYRQVEEGSGQSPVIPVTTTAPAPEVTAAAIAAAITVSSPAQTNARPFDNPNNKPVVALIVGGLGTSARQTRAAIDDLPPEVTLSFIADASPALIRRAREKGHEVLLEVPMEAYERGRMLPHSQTLLADGTAENNRERLDRLLSRSTDFYGVINHHGEKLADADGVLSPVFERLHARGLAFFRHGSTPSKSFDTAAADQDIVYAAASENIDTQVEAEAIERRLQHLESTALADGAALGTGFAYPLTMDIIVAWANKLEGKGILLAPASAVPTSMNPSIQTTKLAGFSSWEASR